MPIFIHPNYFVVVLSLTFVIIMLNFRNWISVKMSSSMNFRKQHGSIHRIREFELEKVSYCDRILIAVLADFEKNSMILNVFISSYNCCGVTNSVTVFTSPLSLSLVVHLLFSFICRSIYPMSLTSYKLSARVGSVRYCSSSTGPQTPKWC